MGILQKFKQILKTNSLNRRENDDDNSCLTHVRPASATVPRTVTATVEHENVRPATPPGSNGPAPSAAQSFRRMDSLRAAVPRIDSVTTKAVGASRFETTIITRQGSRLVLQGVKTMKPDSDDDVDMDEADVEPGTPPSSSILRTAATGGTLNANGAGSITSGHSHASGNGHLYTGPSAGAPGGGSGSGVGGAAAVAGFAGEAPFPLRRKPNRVASLPMLLDGGLPRAPPPTVAADAPAPEYAGPQEPERKQRRPPKRSESLKYLLHLDQYRFNQDVSVQEAREAACGLAPGEGGADGSVGATVGSASASVQGSLEDIISADGSTNSILAVSSALPARMRRPRWSLEDYQLLKQLHRGYASDVYQARCKVSGEMVALKVYKLAEQGDIQRMQLYREIKLHARLRHSNIVQYYACFLEQQRVILVTEYATGGDLLRIMYKCGGRLFERQAVNLVLQPFLTALHYLHTQGIVHRDIKPENVLFAEGKILKLADFGLAINLREERANTRAGTLDYMAPEVLRCPTKKTPDENKGNPESAHYHQAVDAWAVGVFAYELVVGAPPFKAAQMIDTARNIMHAPVSFPETVSDLAKDFIMRALHKDATARLTVLEMLHHPWITMFQRRSSVRIVYTRSNSLMELMPPEAAQGGAGAGGTPGEEDPDGQRHHGHGHGQGVRGGVGVAGGGAGTAVGASSQPGRGVQQPLPAQRRGSGMGYDGASSGGSGGGGVYVPHGSLSPSPVASPRCDTARIRSRLAPQ
ncbi:hypothetical protein Vretimale_6031 [Volvox reticuliferus]|uniref:Protein kinase domain-containing protein n=1 Tax=Volvox reticuliferus TaxID=1737510 RepID=A0A8J4FL08_9CHLO|nr:hypothetical protein Vretifemale_6181 [Volvox reticuliferus]GIM01216.1 hypothetical protein Vretimale_6031 [Volvox reticuliferus]